LSGFIYFLALYKGIGNAMKAQNDLVEVLYSFRQVVCVKE